MNSNPLLALKELGQSIWLDNIRRSLIQSGELKKLVDRDGLAGLTSNPAIFQKAVESGKEYQDLFDRLKDQQRTSVEIYEALAIRDVQEAADVLLPVYRATRGRDGFASLEVSPYLASDTQGTVEEARRLWKALDRPNAMIKVPGTAQGVLAIAQLIAEGINVNVTLLFSLKAYQAVAMAYLDGLSQRSKAGRSVEGVASVASFFVSRIDSAIEKQIARRSSTASAEQKKQLAQVEGKVAIANAKLAYRQYRGLFSGAAWEALARQGAKTQRLLWASTGTKNPKWSDVLYVEELIGPDTVNTVPPATLDAFRDHGKPRLSLEEDLPGAERTMQAVEACGLSIDEITQGLVDEGVELFAEAFDQLLWSIGQKTGRPAGGRLNPIAYSLPPQLRGTVEAAWRAWDEGRKTERLWRKDPSLWTGKDEGQWMGWLSPFDPKPGVDRALVELTEHVKARGFTHALLMGMGGSSLCPEVLSESFSPRPGFPRLWVLDSTDPAQVKAFEGRIDFKKTIFIVSSKSGSTLEPNLFLQYFLSRAKEVLGEDQACRHFVAITDPGSKLEQIAKKERFHAIFPGVPTIGGRYSALSNFGMVPASIIGLDLGRWIRRTQVMIEACQGGKPAAGHPAIGLGVAIGTLAKQGIDKLTLLTSPKIHDLGAWLEQLVAESTGKNGVAVIPVDREAIAPPSSYGDDRFFVHLQVAGDDDPARSSAVQALIQAGRPVVEITLPEVEWLGQELYRWELSTAAIGACLQINPFDQPDVEASKIATRRLTDEYERTGRLPAERPFAEDDRFSWFADPENERSLRARVRKESPAGWIAAHLASAKPGDYFAILAFLEMSRANEDRLQAIRHQIRDRFRIATCLGFGPRFLHSTGQAYKGGSNQGIFLQVTCDDPSPLPIPGQRYSFSVVKAAQARGDFEVLAARRRRALRVHLKGEAGEGLLALNRAVTEAIASL